MEREYVVIEYAAAKRGLRVTCLTISQAQYDYAVERMRKAGLSDRVTIKLQDYRDEKGSYDGIASIEMFEAVGEQYWPSFFKTVHDRLKPGGVACIQSITIRDDLFDRYRRSTDFIQQYIFPGGMLPSKSAFREQARKAGDALLAKGARNALITLGARGALLHETLLNGSVVLLTGSFVIAPPQAFGVSALISGPNYVITITPNTTDVVPIRTGWPFSYFSIFFFTSAGFRFNCCAMWSGVSSAFASSNFSNGSMHR